MKTPFIALASTLVLAFGATVSYSSELKIAINPDIRSVDPGVNRDDNSDMIVLHVVEGLVAYGEDTVVRPLLADSVSTSTDGLTYTFKLRKDVKFHNGAPFTSADVVWSWQRYMDPKTEWRCLPEFDGRGRMKVEKVEAPDPYTVTFQLNRPSALFLATMARPDCGMTGILEKSSLRPDGSFDKPIGTGPFRFVEWRRGEFIRLARFESYTNRAGATDGFTGSKRPLIEELRFIVVPDSATIKAALMSGSVDVAVGVPNSDLAELSKNERLKVSATPGMGILGFLLQTKQGIFSALKMRQAVAAAIDSGQLVNAVASGLVKANNSIVPSASPFYTSVEATGHVFNPDAARRLLAEAGYKGEPVMITAHKQNPAVFDSAIFAQAMLQSVGINASIEVLEPATHLDRYNSGNYQMMAFAYSARLDPALGFEAVTGSKAKQPRKVWDSPEAQALIDKAMTVSEKSERQTLFDQLHKKFISDVPMIVLYNWPDTAALSKRVEGYRTWAGSKPRFWEVSVTD